MLVVHCRRRTWHLAMRGVPLKVIQELLGHASIATTMIYAHLAPHVARDAVRVLDRARVPAAPPPPRSEFGARVLVLPGDRRRGGEGLAKPGPWPRNQLRS